MAEALSDEDRTETVAGIKAFDASGTPLPTAITDTGETADNVEADMDTETGEGNDAEKDAAKNAAKEASRAPYFLTPSSPLYIQVPSDRTAAIRKVVARSSGGPQHVRLQAFALSHSGSVAWKDGKESERWVFLHEGDMQDRLWKLDLSLDPKTCRWIKLVFTAAKAAPLPDSKDAAKTAGNAENLESKSDKSLDSKKDSAVFDFSGNWLMDETGAAFLADELKNEDKSTPEHTANKAKSPPVIALSHVRLEVRRTITDAQNSSRNPFPNKCFS
jgi:hypothetical protein